MGFRFKGWGVETGDRKAGAAQHNKLGAPAKKSTPRREQSQDELEAILQSDDEEESDGKVAGASRASVRRELLALHSQARPANYRLNGDLCQSAQARAEKMNREKRMYHEARWYKRISDAGYQYRTCGENLGAGFSEPDSVMRAWLNSPVHRKNIMNGAFTEVGFGRSGDFWCVHFGDR